MNLTGLLVAVGVFIVNIVVIVLDKTQYIALTQAINMVLVPLVGGLMPTSTTINNPTPKESPDEDHDPAN